MKKINQKWLIAIIAVLLIGGAAMLGRSQIQKGAFSLSLVPEKRSFADLTVNDILTYNFPNGYDYNSVFADISGNWSYVLKRLNKLPISFRISNSGRACAENFDVILTATDRLGHEYRGKYFTNQSPADISALLDYGNQAKLCPGDSRLVHFVFDQDIGTIIKIKAGVDHLNKISELDKTNNVRIENGFLEWLEQ